jgi:hypothetical protein
MAEFMAFYERKYSDGNYGSEGLALSWTWTTDAVEEDEDAAGDMLETTTQFLRTLVLTELAKSAAERVRWAANHELHARDPKPVVERDEVAIAVDGEETSVEDLPF